MKIRVAPSANGQRPTSYQYLTTILVNDTVAIDAGSLGFLPDLDAQRRVEHVLLSHSHVDHLASLPIFLENVYTPGNGCVTVHASDAVRKALQKNLFNDVIWPDFIRLSKEMAPFLELRSLQAGKTVVLGGLRVTPVAVDHIVPTLGFVIEDDEAAVVVATDTAPTQKIWDVARARPNLRAVFLGCSFPSSREGLARTSKHLTPPLFAREVAKVERDVRVFAVHIKGFCSEEVIEELEALALPRFEAIVSGREYEI